ncbi:hypothetical protein ROS62_03745 [Streptomyces sp. DSM 41972]|uniref:Uncharacterized protein n=1 Tax=Streptomyces althioticus subsp. attaecolombicae TaxID=3075534 RepID=A0ABU3HTL6_9ACTN|nr:hypothetical protein [Streptomyces sp. DSM 41972]
MSRVSRAQYGLFPRNPNSSAIRAAGSTPGSVIVATPDRPYTSCTAITSGRSTDQSV